MGPSSAAVLYPSTAPREQRDLSPTSRSTPPSTPLRACPPALGAALVTFAADASAHNIATAKKIAAGVIAECQKNSWNVAVAVVGVTGDQDEQCAKAGVGST
jgi:hypothetical protein